MKIRILTMLLAGGLPAGAAWAQVVSFDVPGNFAGQVFNAVTTANYSGYGAVVDPYHTYWNAVHQNGTTPAGLLSDGATASAVTFTDTSTLNYGGGVGQGGNGTAGGLGAPFILTKSGATITDTLNHVPAGTYNLYLYGYNYNDSDRGATFTVSTSLAGATSLSTSNTTAGNGTFINGNNYVKFANLAVGADGAITIKWAANTAVVRPAGASDYTGVNGEGDFNGLQLIPSVSDTNVQPVFPMVVVPSLNTNEVVVAATTPQQYGARGDGITDDSGAFQAAINAVYNSGGSGGGVVYVPAGNYAFYTNITVQTGVTLHGNWQDWTKGTGGLVGTTFKVYYGAGQTNAAPFIYLQGSAALRDVNIWYPNQNPNSITSYPFSVGLANDCVVQNVALVNSYQGIEVTAANGGAKWIVSSVVGSPLFMGLTADDIADICQTEDIRFSPDVWANSQLTNAPAAGGAYATWMRTYGTGILLYRLDGLINVNTEISGYNVGLDFESGAYGAAGAAFYNGAVTNCATALLAQEMQTASALEFSYFTLDGDIAINRTHTTNDAAADFDDCQIIGRNGVAVHCAGADWQSTMAFQNCAISNALQLAGPGVFNLVNCGLSGSTQCVMSASATRAAFTGCTFSPAQNLVNLGNGGNLIVDSRSAQSNAMPVVNWTNVMNDYATRRPAKTDLYVVTNALWGAKGNGTADDTAAIQKALTAAGTNGGGIVYLPAGKYRLTSTLTVPGGVELRGSYEVRHRTWPGADNVSKGAILQPYGGQGTTNGPPAVVLQTNAGLVGMTISYESQNSNCIPFPPTIQGQGGNIYVIGVQCPNPYYYVDLDTHTCTNHFLDMVDGWAILTGVHIGNGSSGSIVDCHANWTYWIDNYGSASDLQGTGGNVVESFAMHNLFYYVLGDCTELFVKDFSIIENTYLYEGAENGRGPNFTGISATCDSSYHDFVFDAAAPCTFNDVNPDWLVPLSGGYADLTNATAFLSTTNFQGRARFFNLPLWGSPVWDCVVNGGDVGLELAHLWQHAYNGSLVNGGVFHLINAGAYSAVNGGSGNSPYNVNFGPNPGPAGQTNEFIGCYAYNGFNYTNDDTGNPTNVWVDYALSSYNELGGPPNLALGRPVVASSVADGTVAASAVDGNLSTRWGSAYSDPQWIYVDLGTNYNINIVELVWESAYGKAYQIQVSTNASTWTTIFSTNSAAGGTDYLTGLNGVGRYVRMYGTQRGLTQYGYSLWEFEVFGTLAVPPVATNSPPLMLTGGSGTGQLQFNWPADHVGWRLEVQTNSTGLGLGTNWVTVPNSTTTNQMTLPISVTNGATFYRLVYP